jgi:hypothetical protein
MAGPYPNSFAEMGLNSPAGDAFTITPSDSTDFANDTRGIYVGVTGNVSAVMQTGVTVVFIAVPAGTVLPIRVHRVNSTGTTASSLVGLL